MACAPEIVFIPAEVRTREGRVLIVREYKLDDFGALIEMYRGFEPKRVAQGLPPPDIPRIARWLDQLQHKSRSLLALEGKRIVGHVILCPISDAAVEYTIFVQQDFRDQGIGTAMTRLALKLAYELSFAEVFLTTELSNFPASRLYHKVGFRVTCNYGGEYEMKINVAAAEGVRARAA